ncbi:hypothetical protein LCGC14_0408140 [marine sediment metagenome]|uniref:Wadjet protein JetD C-terminal domain-containing protein n=2 Tax=root TaxID=1 RepID=A0A7V1FP43_9RHOB|nr:hypothetical protein [Sulfitobacter litoralis]
MIANGLFNGLQRDCVRFTVDWIDGKVDPISYYAKLSVFRKLPIGRMAAERNRFTELFGDRVEMVDQSLPGVRGQPPVPMPNHVTFAGPDDLLSCVWSDEWPAMKKRFLLLKETIGRLVALRNNAHKIINLSDADFEALVAFAAWRRAEPEARPYLRSLNLPGVGTKWLERNIRLCRLVCADLGLEGSQDCHIEACGLHREDRREATLKWNEDAYPSPFGNTSMTVRISEVKSSPVLAKIGVVIVVENLEMLDKMRPAPDVLILFGAGHAVGPILADMGCLAGAEIIYWGDADSHGFACLSEARRARPDLRSHRMTPEILENCAHLMRPEPDAARLLNAPSGLTPDEARCCEALKEKWLRLEQEFDEDGVDELAARGLVDPLTERHMAATTEPEPEPKSKLSALRKILSAH